MNTHEFIEKFLEICLNTGKQEGDIPGGFFDFTLALLRMHADSAPLPVEKLELLERRITSLESDVHLSQVGKRK